MRFVATLALLAAFCAATTVSTCHAQTFSSTSKKAAGVLAMSKSIRDFGVLPTNTPAKNKENLQKAIDWASTRGAALFVEPSDEPYPVDGGIILRTNASLIGVHGPVGRGTKHPTKAQPVGSVFSITDTAHVFITVQSATQLRGLQFYYPNQTIDDPSKVIAYPPTIQVTQTAYTASVTLSSLTFFGEYMAMDFNSPESAPCEQILFEHCYGYPLGGEFIRIDHCYDIPRILHCHVNPGVQRIFKGDYPKAMIDSVVARGHFTYAINHTDNAQIMDIFTFGAFGGIYLGPATYGQLTNFNFDCVSIGIHKLGDNSTNRNWQISQGSIIANTGARLEDVHPILIEGQGHTALSNVEGFSGNNPVISNFGQSQDYLLVRGDGRLTVSIFGARMRNYAAASPITNQNPNAQIQAVACVDKDENLFNRTLTKGAN